MNKYILDFCKLLLPERMVEKIQYRGGQRIVEQIPLHKAVTTHSALKTFITLVLSYGIPIQNVLKMSSHNDFKELNLRLLLAKNTSNWFQRSGIFISLEQNHITSDKKN